jgi:hypothetical protein
VSQTPPATNGAGCGVPANVGLMISQNLKKAKLERLMRLHREKEEEEQRMRKRVYI